MFAFVCLQLTVVSEQQCVSCSTTCVDKYANLTKQCCYTGNNKDSYPVPLDILKAYVGQCPTPTTTLRTASSATVNDTTTKLPYTIPPKTTNCAKCAGPEILCEKLYEVGPCDPPNNYCINKIVNHNDGTRIVTRGCGTFQTCYKDWFLGSSDIDKCRLFDENNFITLQFDCTFCCVTDGCNVPLRPASDTLYRDL